MSTKSSFSFRIFYYLILKSYFVLYAFWFFKGKIEWETREGLRFVFSEFSWFFVVSNCSTHHNTNKIFHFALCFGTKGKFIFDSANTRGKHRFSLFFGIVFCLFLIQVKISPKLQFSNEWSDFIHQFLSFLATFLLFLFCFILHTLSKEIKDEILLKNTSTENRNEIYFWINYDWCYIDFIMYWCFEFLRKIGFRSIEKKFSKLNEMSNEKSGNESAVYYGNF